MHTVVNTAANTVAIVDYGMGNLRSVAKAVEHVAPAACVKVTSDPAVVAASDRVIVPGQGAMPDCMRELTARGLDRAVIEAAAAKPFLGICIGLQMLFESSEEGAVAGLGVLSGRVRRFAPGRMRALGLKVPHMGWNEVHQTQAHPLWAGIEEAARFYFVHSFYVEAADETQVVATCEHGLPFTCAVAKANIFAVQFHPEKSAGNGLALLDNFMHWNP